jgi:glycosyltransferase involved in cell wall biosynthesis
VQVKTISIVTPCYNEQDNIREVYRQVREIMVGLQRYCYEHIFIDNASTDRTAELLKELAAADTNVKIIRNARNVGHIRSPAHALLQARGDAMILLVADLQDPPALITQFIEGWESGLSMVIGIKRSSEEASWMFFLRKQYYKLVDQISNTDTFQNFTGFGLYDRRVIEYIRSFGDQYPYFRGMLAEIGLPHKKIYYDQPVRKFGVTKNNWYSLYDIGMLGIVNNTRVPLRMAAFAGFGGAGLSLFVALCYTLAKIIFWNSFRVGTAPTLIGVFFFASLQLVFMGVIGEYVGAIYTQVQHRPYAIELERINFEIPAQQAKPYPPILPSSETSTPPSASKLQKAGTAPS